MKRLILTIIASVGIVAVMPLSAVMAASSSIDCVVGGDTACTEVAGTVTNSSTKATVAGASVVVTCGDSNVLDATTTTGGGYLVIFPASECPDATTASVTASKGGASGSGSSTVYNFVANVNLAIVNVSIVPELGAITATGAGVAALGAFMFIRRRQTSTN
jgi:hypothetical protein